MSDVVKQLNAWLGIQHLVSLVDRHESNGVEHANKLILRHLRAIVFDERLQSCWSDPCVLAWVAIMLNSFKHSETGATPYELTFGSKDATYFKPPDDLGEEQKYSKFLVNLNTVLQRIRELSHAFQQELAAAHVKDNVEVQTLFKPGDFVLLHHPERVSKLQPLYRGPFEVISQCKNDVEVRNIIRGNVSKLHVSRVKIFHGSREDAFKMAQLDNDEYEIDQFLAYRGDPLIRTTMEFLVRFCDSSELWLPWSADLFSTIPYEIFCSSHPELRPLLHTAKKANNDVARLKKSVISEVQSGDVVFVDLRSYGAGWYDTLNLPDKYRLKYVLEYFYLEFIEHRTRIRCYCKVFDEYFIVDRDFVQRYGSVRKKPPDAILIDAAFCAKYPEILPKLQFITAVNIVLESRSKISFLNRP